MQDICVVWKDCGKHRTRGIWFSNIWVTHGVRVWVRLGIEAEKVELLTGVDQKRGRDGDAIALWGLLWFVPEDPLPCRNAAPLHGCSS